MLRRKNVICLYALSMIPMILPQYGNAWGIDSHLGFMSVAHIGGLVCILCEVIALTGKSLDGFRKMIGFLGLVGIVLCELFTFLTWFLWPYLGIIGLNVQLDWTLAQQHAFPTFYVGLLFSLAAIVVFVVLWLRSEEVAAKGVALG